MKNLKALLAIILFLSSILTSCSRKEKTPAKLQEVFPIDVTELIDPPQNAENWIEDIVFIPLETNENCLLSSRMMHYDINSNAILCCFKNKINLLDINGKHIRSFTHLGKGPGEYGQLWEAHFIPNKKEILISDKNNKKVVIYDYNGQYLHEFKIPYQWWDIIPIDENNIAIYMGKNLSPVPPLDQNYQFLTMDFEGKIIGGLMPYKYKMGPSYSIELSKLTEEGKYIISPPFQYNIYQFSPNENFKMIYQFDLGKEGIDTTLISNEDFMKKSPDAKGFGEGIPNLGYLGVNSNSIIFSQPKANYKRMVLRLINRKSGNQRSLVLDSLFNAGYYQGFPVFLLPTRGFSDYFVTVREAIDIKEIYSKLNSGQISELSKFKGFNDLENITENDNPVLILFKLKDF